MSPGDRGTGSQPEPLGKAEQGAGEQQLCSLPASPEAEQIAFSSLLDIFWENQTWEGEGSVPPGVN